MADNAVRKLKPAARKIHSLRDRIPAVPPARAEALRTFFAAPRRWLLGDGGALRFVPGAAAVEGEAFCIDAEGTRLQLRLETDAAVPPAASGLHWSDYQGRARLLAWSLAHETSLMRLSEVLGVSLLPLEQGDRQAEDPQDDAIWLAFASEHDRDARVVPLRGALRAPVAWVARLQSRAEPIYEDDPLPPLGVLQALPVPVLLGFDGPRLDPADWQRLRPGDVVVIGNGRVPPMQARAPHCLWPLAAAPDGWRIASAAQALPFPLEHSTMNDESPNGTGGSAEPDNGEAIARTLPVQLAFDIGRVEINIGDLAALQPGYVFALSANLEGANVTIRANGRAAGRGEVVAVGNTLGVRLLSWD